jgi:hypothetical protein
MDHYQNGNAALSNAMNHHANSYVTPNANAAPNMTSPVSYAPSSKLPAALMGLGAGALGAAATAPGGMPYPAAPAGRTSAGAILVLFILLVIVSRLSGAVPYQPCKKKC